MTVPWTGLAVTLVPQPSWKVARPRTVHLEEEKNKTNYALMWKKVRLLYHYVISKNEVNLMRVALNLYTKNMLCHSINLSKRNLSVFTESAHWADSV